MRTVVQAEALISTDALSETAAPLKLVEPIGKWAVHKSLLTLREFTDDLTWLAKFRSDRSSDDFIYLPHTYDNDALMDYDSETGEVYVGYQSSAEVVGMLQMQDEVRKALALEGKEAPERRFSFIGADGKLYKNLRLDALIETMPPTKDTHKHIAIFEGRAVRIDDIYCISMTPVSDEEIENAGLESKKRRSETQAYFAQHGRLPKPEDKRDN